MNNQEINKLINFIEEKEIKILGLFDVLLEEMKRR